MKRRIALVYNESLHIIVEIHAFTRGVIVVVLMLQCSGCNYDRYLDGDLENQSMFSTSYAAYSSMTDMFYFI